MRTITILPQLDGITLAPILVTNPFEVDLAQVQSRDGLRLSSNKPFGGVSTSSGATTFNARPAAAIIPPVKRRSLFDDKIVRANANLAEKSGRRPVSQSSSLPHLPLPRPFARLVQEYRIRSNLNPQRGAERISSGLRE